MFNPYSHDKLMPVSIIFTGWGPHFASPKLRTAISWKSSSLQICAMGFCLFFNVRVYIYTHTYRTVGYQPAGYSQSNLVVTYKSPSSFFYSLVLLFQHSITWSRLIIESAFIILAQRLTDCLCFPIFCTDTFNILVLISLSDFFSHCWHHCIL